MPVSQETYWKDQTTDLWAYFPLLGPVRFTTLATFGMTFLLVLYWKRKLGFRSLFYSIVAVFAPASYFEVLFIWTGVLYKGWPLEGRYLLASGALFGWVLLGAYLTYHNILNPSTKILYSLFAFIWLAWIISGFNYNIPGALIDWLAETFNIVTKALISLAFAFHVRTDKA